MAASENDGGSVVMAQIGAPHGVRGEVRLKVFAEDADTLKGLALALPDGRPVRITHLRALKGEMFVARLEGVSDRDAAEALRLKTLRVDRADLPMLEDDTFYIADLVGLEVRNAAGAPIGRVLAVHDFGAGDILEVRAHQAPEGGGSRDSFHPFTREAVPELDMSGGWLTLRPDLAEDGEDET
ncbi:MAG: ribosome maturation factor RimM [Pseudomonadota bacterium]